MIKVISIDFKNIHLRVEAFYIRTQVFVFEQHVDPSLEYDEFDDVARHYLAYTDDLPTGTARWRQTPEGIKLERFAVLSPYRNKGIGKALLDTIMKEVSPLSGHIYLHAQIQAVPFYERHGFVTEGEPFFEAGMKHFSMVWTGSSKH